MSARKMSFLLKTKTQEFCFGDDRYQIRFRMNGVLVAEMHTYRFGFRELESVSSAHDCMLFIQR